MKILPEGDLFSATPIKHDAGPRVLGVDPGVNGAAAIFCPQSIVKIPPFGIIRLPTLEKQLSTKTPSGKLKVMHIIDDARFWQWLQYHQPTHAFVEQVWAMPPKKVWDERSKKFLTRDAGNQSSFNFGRAYGSVRTAIACFLGRQPEEVPPARWQRMFGLHKLGEGVDKGEASRQLVLQRHPSAAPFLQHKKDHNGAEAQLIAEFGAEQLWRISDADEIEE